MKIASGLMAMTIGIMDEHYPLGKDISVDKKPSNRDIRTPDQVAKLKEKAAKKRARKAKFRCNQLSYPRNTDDKGE